MAELLHLERLVNKLRNMAARAKDANVAAIVGYTAAYAVWVHENRAMTWKGLPRKSEIGVYWGPNGRAGFLLDVMREMQDVLADIVTSALQKGKTMAQALLLAGLRLQRESMLNVPVEFGNLKNSAFTRIEPVNGE